MLSSYQRVTFPRLCLNINQGKVGTIGADTICWDNRCRHYLLGQSGQILFVGTIGADTICWDNRGLDNICWDNRG